ncbi:MAG: extracellular solute-binding protein [Anaerolineae bacterium]|nr:extracellular solute-binding protein [Anaerolineae bacterium]
MLALLVLAGCRQDSDTVVVYTSRDQLYAEPILRAFEHETGIQVQAVYDTGATKTVGLTNRLLAEKDHPQADVFWNSEVARTIRLQRAGVLASYVSPQATTIPARFKDPQGYWTGFGARARVIIYNTRMLSKEAVPTSLFELTDPRWRGKVTFGQPILGTMATHNTALFLVLGSERASSFFRALRANDILVIVGNTAVRDAVSRGDVPLGIIDTSDAYEAMADGAPVDIVFPDQDGIGTLVIPNTVALIAGGPHPENGRRFIDYMLRPETERALAWSRSAQIPLHPGVETPEHVRSLDEIVMLDVDYYAIADHLDEVCTYLDELFLR